MRATVVALYDRTGVGLLPWAEAGYDCEAVDMSEDKRRVDHPRIRFVRADVRQYVMPKHVRFCIGWPPCTHLAASGARWWKTKGEGALAEALDLVGQALFRFQDSGAPWVIENPMGRLSTIWRKPDVSVHPWQYAGWISHPEENAYTKKTGLWLGGGAKPPAPYPVPGLPIDTKRILYAPSSCPSRSITPLGLAAGLWVANDRPDLAPAVSPAAMLIKNYPITR